MSLFFVCLWVLFVFVFETRIVCVALTVLELALKPGWPSTHTDPSASAF